MKKILKILFVVGIIYICFFHRQWLIILTAIVALFLVALFILGLRKVDKREKEIKSYLDECDEKLKKGDMTKEDNEQIHFYWEMNFFG